MFIGKWVRGIAALLLSFIAPIAGADSSLTCSVYPIALPLDRVGSATSGQVFTELPRGNGTGQFSWLTWAGDASAPTLATSLTAPGNVGTFVNPDRAGDHNLDEGDFVEGAPGSMNAAAVRDKLDLLIGKDIVVPVWDATRG